jgi:hypothetical protein
VRHRQTNNTRQKHEDSTLTCPSAGPTPCTERGATERVKGGLVVEHKGHTACAVNPVIAAKKDPETGLWTDHRVAQDYRPVSKHMRADRYGMHSPEDIFHQCAQAKVFSKLDLRQGFFQIPIAPEDPAKTAYWMGNKLMMYFRMPYGPKNASVKFPRVMDYELAQGGLDHCARAYVDDVLIYSDSPEEHVTHVAAHINPPPIEETPDRQGI